MTRLAISCSTDSADLVNFRRAEIVREGGNVAAGELHQVRGTAQDVASGAQLISGFGYCGKTAGHIDWSG